MSTMEQMPPPSDSRFSAPGRTAVALPESAFVPMLCLERKRAERSGRSFLLTLIALAGEGLYLAPADCDQLGAALAAIKRETDFCGWYETGRLVGLVYTDIDGADPAALRTAVRERVKAAWGGCLNAAQWAKVEFAFHWFPETPGAEALPPEPALYPDLEPRRAGRRLARAMKRGMDVAGSLAALALLSPVFALAALAIKFTSPGPVFYRQRRLGRFGVPFTLLKFRSMHVASDSRVHEEFVKQFIAGQTPAAAHGGPNAGPKVFKLQNDSRVTRVGRWLRTTSLDEVPQFWNVLRGDMSLVGPRPPIAYEAASYQTWHRRRIFEAKPGITGLWQVEGRSRTAFDEMVRLDLRYVRGWSLWLDLKILLRTPRAVLFGSGAY